MHAHELEQALVPQDGETLVFDTNPVLNERVTHYCPGCHHGIAHRLVSEVLHELGVADRTILVASVGCATFTYDYFNVDGLEAPHGRACAVATGIKRTVFELMATMTEPSELRDIPFANFDAAMVSTAASHGDPIALEAFRITGELLGYALADAVTITSPEAIFLFGGLAKSGKYIFEPTQWYMEENMMSVFKNKVKLLPSGIQSQNAAILGASALIWQEVKQLGA